jgi:hypothetical protein
MARIPVYTQQTQAPGGVSLGNLRVPDMNLDAVGRGLQQVGQAMGQVAQVGLKIDEENAKVEANDIYAKSEELWGERLINYKNEAGPGAKDLIRTVGTDFDKWSNERLAEVKNPRAQRLLAGNLASLRRSVMSQAITFQASEGINYRYNTQIEANNALGRKIMMDPSEINFSRILENARIGIAELDMPASKKQELEKDLLAKLGKAGAEAMARDFPQVLIAQMDSAKKRGAKDTSGSVYLDLIPATEWDTYRNIAQNNVDMGSARVMANTAFQSFVQTDRDPVSLDKMRRYVDENYPGITEKERTAAYQLLDDLARTHNYSVKERVNSEMSDVLDIGLSKGLSAMQASQQFRNLRPSEQADLMNKVSNFNKKSATDDDWDTYLEYISDPVALGQMSPQEVNVLAAGLGGDLGRKLKEQRARLATNADVLNAKIDNDTFNATLPAFGLDPRRRGDRVKIAMVRDRVEEALTLRAQRKQAPLTIDEKRDEMQRLAKDVVREGWFFKSDVPRITLPAEDQRKTSVLYNGVEVKLSDVPPSIIEATDAAFRKIRRVPTARDYVEQWIAEGRPSK